MLGSLWCSRSLDLLAFLGKLFIVPVFFLVLVLMLLLLSLFLLRRILIRLSHIILSRCPATTHNKWMSLSHAYWHCLLSTYCISLPLSACRFVAGFPGINLMLCNRSQHLTKIYFSPENKVESPWSFLLLAYLLQILRYTLMSQCLDNRLKSHIDHVLTIMSGVCVRDSYDFKEVVCTSELFEGMQAQLQLHHF